MNIPLNQLLTKKRRWGVSAIALAYRLHDIGLLTDWLYHTTCVNLSRMGYRSGEPGRSMERESSRLLSQVMADLLKTPGSFNGLCHELAVSSQDINNLVFNLAPTVVEGDQELSAPIRPPLRIVEGSVLFNEDGFSFPA
jgi:hypothetical protein